MNIQQQWCDNRACPSYCKTAIGNIKVYSYAERRYYCYTCGRTFSFDQGTFFETLRTSRQTLLDAVSMLVERNSLRAISRIKVCKPNSVLRWMELAGQHAVAMSDLLIRDLHLTQVQIDELYTFVKKRDLTHTVRPVRRG